MDDLARLTELRRNDPDIEQMCNIIVARHDCASVQRLQNEHPEVFADLVTVALALAGLDPEPGSNDEWPVR